VHQHLHGSLDVTFVGQHVGSEMHTGSTAYTQLQRQDTHTHALVTNALVTYAARHTRSTTDTDSIAQEHTRTHTRAYLQATLSIIHTAQRAPAWHVQCPPSWHPSFL